MHVDGNNKRKLLIVAFFTWNNSSFPPTHLQQSFINCFNVHFFVVIKIHELMSDMYHVETAKDVRSILMCGVCDDGWERGKKRAWSPKNKLFLTHFSLHYDLLCHTFSFSVTIFHHHNDTTKINSDSSGRHEQSRKSFIDCETLAHFFRQTFSLESSGKTS